ncbi:MAG: hypothetical protein PHV32_11070, partial [Eubacteriales bacterium]|nr:hypothetical protein [Eubacteriales bacterium]
FKENNVLLYIIVTVPKPEEAEDDEDTDYEGYKKVEQGEYKYFEKRSTGVAAGEPLEAEIIWHSDIGKIVLNGVVPQSKSFGLQDDALDFVNFELAQQVYSCIKTEAK